MTEKCLEIKDEMTNVDAKIVDVREPMEVVHGKLPCSVNVPMNMIYQVSEMFEPEDHLFLYCHTGRRSAQAEIILKNMGYVNVKNIGGVNDFYDCLVPVCS